MMFCFLCNASSARDRAIHRKESERKKVKVQLNYIFLTPHPPKVQKTTGPCLRVVWDWSFSRRFSPHPSSWLSVSFVLISSNSFLPHTLFLLVPFLFDPFFSSLCMDLVLSMCEFFGLLSALLFSVGYPCFVEGFEERSTKS